MGCFGCGDSKTSSTLKASPSTSIEQNPERQTLKEDVQLHIQGTKVHLMDGGEALELAYGELKMVKILDDNVSLATVVKVGDDLQWPLTKDEPVVKMDALHYLFSLPVKDGEPLSYGVSFPQQSVSNLGLLDSFLKEHSCFSELKSSDKKKEVDWQEYAPKIEDYNNFLAKAIARGTGQIVKGIFTCTNAYTNQVQKGGEMILHEQEYGVSSQSDFNNGTGAKKKNAVNKALKRARKISKMTEKISKSMLGGVGIVTGSVMRPVVKSQAGKAFLTMLPGQVLLASLDAVNKVLDAAEMAEKQALSSTSKAATRMVTRRFGENAGGATEDVLATAGHCANTAWNIFKIRKVINPASSSVSSGMLKKAAKIRNPRY